MRNWKVHVTFRLKVHLKYKMSKGKLKVIKCSKMPFYGLQFLLTGLWDLKDIPNSNQTLVGKK